MLRSSLCRFLACALLPLAAQAQQTPHVHDFRCGISLEDGDLIKQRLMENRRNISPQQILQFQTQRNTKYIPISFHLVGDASGNGRVDFEAVLANLCDINVDYADQNIQFYLKDTLRLLNNQGLYNDATTFQSSSTMFNNKVPGSVNLYMSPTPNNAAASFYSPVGDYVFVINSEVSSSSNTATHELGHFFDLPHTFFGWEGVDVEAQYPNNAPTSVGGRAVERFSRTTNANCGTAADGFCDTPADYYSDRVPCPYQGTAKDPTGTPIAPDVSNYMSYFFNQCVTRFSTEQKAAMAADIISRGWSNLPAPPMINTPDATNIQGTPANGQTVGVGGGGTLTLSWNSVPDANAYIVYMERTIQGVSIGQVFKRLLYGANNTSLSFDASILPAQNGQYRWKVQPINTYKTCNNYSSDFDFRTTTSITTGLDQDLSAQTEFRLLNNPIQQSQAQFLVNLPQDAQTSLQVYGFEGRLVSQMPSQWLQAGDQILELDLQSLPNGLYTVILQVEGQQKVLKMQVLR